MRMRIAEVEYDSQTERLQFVLEALETPPHSFDSADAFVTVQPLQIITQPIAVRRSEVNHPEARFTRVIDGVLVPFRSTYDTATNTWSTPVVET